MINFERAIGKCLCSGFSAWQLLPPSKPTPKTGEELGLPPRVRGGLGWGRCLNLCAKTFTNRVDKVYDCLHASETLAHPANAALGTRASRPQFL